MYIYCPKVDRDRKFVFFFFSSRRRHTICYRDWSSDVCSSDLAEVRLDLRWSLPREVLDRVEALRLSDVLATERADKHVSRLLQTAQRVDVAVDVQRRVAHRVIELAALAERAGDVEAHNE